MLNKIDEFRKSFLEERSSIKKIVDLLKGPEFDQNGPPIVLIHALAELIVNHAVIGKGDASKENVEAGLNAAAMVLVSYGLAVHKARLLSLVET